MLMYAVLLLCVSGTLARYRIIGGSDVDISSHPHQVSLQWKSSSCTTAGTGYCHICGASILSEYWILTAAHCVEGGAVGDFVVGAEFPTGQIRDEEYTRHAVASIKMHEQYNTGQGAFPNDVALIRLASPINLQGSKHQAIQIADSGEGFDGVNCTISGWGLDSSDDIPNQLQHTWGIIDPSCGSWTTNNYNYRVHICIHNANTGSCNGDSGGPMVCNGKLAGVTSWGAAGCRTDYQSVYARVSAFNTWINDNMI